MTPSWRILEGDCRDVLRSLPERSVHTVVTSPPYFGLRSYLENGHEDKHREIGAESTPDEFVASLVAVFREVRRVLRDDGTCWINLGDSYGPGKQLLGMPWRFAFAMQRDGWVLRSDVVWNKANPMPESVTDRPTKAHEMLFLFAKGARSDGRFAHLSDDDARWLALLFDTEGNIVIKRADRDGRLQYGAQMAFANTRRALLERARRIVGAGSIHERAGRNAPVYYWQMGGREARDLLHRIYPFLIVKQRQARVAIHMQDVVAQPKRRPGGYRSPEHAAFLERCWQTVKALNRFGDPELSWVPEPVFLLSKGPRYFYDADAIREPHTDSNGSRDAAQRRHGTTRSGVQVPGATLDESPYVGQPKDRGLQGVGTTFGGWDPAGRNKRSVWTVATQPYAGAHFATFPPKLVEPCVLAGAPERACGVCGAPWERVVERTPAQVTRKSYAAANAGAVERHRGLPERPGGFEFGEARTVGFEPSCDHGDGTATGVVLDPFAGAGTTGLVALRHNRSFIGIELNPAYAEMARERIRQDAPLLNTHAELAA